MDVGTVLVRSDPNSAAVVRRQVEADLVSHHLTRDSIEDVVLVVSELVTNAVLHAQGGSFDGLDVAWDVLDRCVVVRVNDTSDRPPERRPADPRATGGRGLAIVASIADEWGIRPQQRGKQVWARVPVHRTV